MNKVLVILLFFIFLTAAPAIAYPFTGSNDSGNEEIDTQLNSLWDLYEAAEQPDSALYYMGQLKKLALLNNKTKWIASAYWAIADVQYEQGYLGDAVYNYLEAAKVFEQINRFDRLANVYNSIGDIYVLAKDYNAAVDYFLKAKDIFLYERDHKEMAMVCINLGICYTEQGDFGMAEAVLEEGKAQAVAAKDYVMLSMIHNSLGVANFRQKEYGAARKNYNMAIQTSDSLEGNDKVEVYAINNIGEAYLYEKDFEQAEVWLLKALNVKKGMGDPLFVQSTLNLLGRLYIDQEEYERAIALLDGGLQKIDLNIIDGEVELGLSLIVEALVKVSSAGDPSKHAYLNQRFATYSQKLIAYNNQLLTLREELETIGKQQVVKLAVEKHSMNARLGAAEERNEQIKYAMLIPVFLLICAIVSVYLALRRNARYKKLYAGIEDVLSKSRALRGSGHK